MLAFGVASKLFSDSLAVYRFRQRLCKALVRWLGCLLVRVFGWAEIWRCKLGPLWKKGWVQTVPIWCCTRRCAWYPCVIARLPGCRQMADGCWCVSSNWQLQSWSANDAGGLALHMAYGWKCPCSCRDDF